MLNPLRQVISDTSKLIADIRRGASHLGWRLSWWRRKRQIRAQEESAADENLRRGAAAATKMCQQCRALIPSSADACPECEALTGHIRSGGAGRRLSLILPFEVTVTNGIITAFFLTYLLGMILSLALEPRGLDPAPSPFGVLWQLDSRALIFMGANHGMLSGGPEPWRLVTALFLHAGLLHLAFNTMAMVWFGQVVEHVYGPSRMFFLFVASGALGNLASLAWKGESFHQVGASGAIFGLVGVAARYAFTHKDALADALRNMIPRVVLWAVVMSFIPFIDSMAHFAGMAAGAGLAWVLPDPARMPGLAVERLWRYAARALALGCGAAFLFTVVRWAVMG